MSELAIREDHEHQDRRGWVELARRNNDGLEVILRTLGEKAMADTPASVDAHHVNGVSLHKEGALQEVADVYVHTMAYVSDEEAKIAFPPPNQMAA